MLTCQILNSDATLNNFIDIGSKEFIPGEEFILVVRGINKELDLRYIPLSTTVATCTLLDIDGNTISKVATLMTDDRSIMSIAITEAESDTLASGTITFSLDELGDGTKITKGIAEGALVRSIDGDC